VVLTSPKAGSTLLAFGNGSPDVFSTFAAMSANSGSLAIGELLGAAAFIVSVVAGIMTLVKPFKVARHSFLRDVGFFTMAVALMLVILWDKVITRTESALMVLLYVLYVITVAATSWWHGRRERIREGLRRAREEYAEEEVTGTSSIAAYRDASRQSVPSFARKY
jgi:sodium/potassium/calcium exchanger 6